MWQPITYIWRWGFWFFWWVASIWLALFIVRAMIILLFNFDSYLWLKFQIFRFRIWTSPNFLTGRLILTLPQPERDYALERFGYGRFIDFSSISPIYQDDRSGLLYKFTFNNEDYTVVSVLNASPEPDNTYTRHYIRVPNHIRTVQSAVAWTFELVAEEYDPDIET
jgi:hypothetical protein